MTEAELSKGPGGLSTPDSFFMHLSAAWLRCMTRLAAEGHLSVFCGGWASSQLGASAESGFLHHGGFLPKHTFRETKAEASRFVMAQPQRSGPLPLTSLGYTGQPRLGEGVYKGVNAKECGPLGGRLSRPAPSVLTFPSLSSPGTCVHPQLSSPLRSLSFLSFLSPCSTANTFVSLVSPSGNVRAWSSAWTQIRFIPLT